MFKKKVLIFLVFLLFSTWAFPVEAGFGVSPPTIRNRQLTPGSVFKKEIRILRSSAEEELKAEVKINAPEIDSWISIDKGNEFIMPKGDLQVPMMVTFNIPKDAELGDYNGHINVRIMPSGEKQSGVAIALGARIDIDLALTNVSFSDFLIRVVSIPNFEKLGKPWNWKVWEPIFEKLFYKINLIMNIENVGNIKTAPSKVEIEIYDISKNKLLEKSVDKSLKKVNSFSTENVTASFPTKLEAGQYWSKIKIYKGSQIVNFYEVAFTVEKPGVLGKSASSLGIWPWLVMALLISLVVAFLLFLIKIRIWRYFIALIAMILRPIFSGSIKAIKNINKKFWKWVVSQAEKHKN